MQGAAQKSFRLPLKKRLLTHPAMQAFAAWLMASLLKVFWLTFRKQIHVHPDAAPYLSGEQQAIFAFWHGRMILFPFFKPKPREMHVLISHHRDGELIARLISHFDIASVRGSSSKGAKEATQRLLEKIAQGQNISITPDGPRGPAFQAQRGALHLARLSQQPLLPVSFAASRYTQLKSWDGFIIPHPFAQIRVEIAAPLRVARDATLADLKISKAALEAALNAAGERADNIRN